MEHEIGLEKLIRLSDKFNDPRLWQEAFNELKLFLPTPDGITAVVNLFDIYSKQKVAIEIVKPLIKKIDYQTSENNFWNISQDVETIKETINQDF